MGLYDILRFKGVWQVPFACFGRRACCVYGGFGVFEVGGGGAFGPLGGIRVANGLLSGTGITLVREKVGL